MTKILPDRRQAMIGLLAVASAGLVAGCKEKDVETTSSSQVEANTGSGGFLSAAEYALLASMAQTIIPKTETAGAIEAGVPDTLQELLTGWGDDEVRVYWRNGLSSISDHFASVDGGGVFADLDVAKQEELLEAFDKSVYKNEIENAFYKDMKQAVARAYYMSEPGATEELAYDPVPGDFKGCIPFSDVGKAWAT